MFVCSYCRQDFKKKLSDDVGLYAHWSGDYYLIDVVLLFEEASRLPVLYREVYVVELV